MPDFDWHIEEEVNRFDAQPAAGMVKPRRRRWLTVLLVLTIVASAGVLIVQALTQRAENERLETIKEDVLAAHSLMRRAAAQGDAEIFGMLLSGDDLSWRKAQHDLLSRELVESRAPLGLIAQPGEPAIHITLTHGLTEAEVLSEQTYAVSIGRETTQTIRLRHVAFYRLDGQRWFLSPPGDEFWGKWITTTGQLLTLTYPERDQDIAARLARDLDLTLNDMCAELGEWVCPSDAQLRIRLNAQPSSLIQMLDSEMVHAIASGHTFSITLPSPTLFGTPTDESGYQELYRRYAVRTVAILARSRITLRLNRDPDLAKLYDSAIDRLLVQKGLRPWPAIEVKDSSGAPPPVPPGQDIAVYCVESPRTGGSLYRYAPSTVTWTIELSGRSFTSMLSLPSREGLVFQERPMLTPKAPARLILWQDGRERLLLQPPSDALSVFFAGEADPFERRLVVGFFFGIGRPQNYALLDLGECIPSGCAWIPLPSVPIWSPDGSHTLVGARRRAELLLGDENAEPLLEVGSGFNPFWLNNATFGYFAYRTSERGADIVTATIDNPKPQIAVQADDLQQTLPERVRQGSIRSSYYPPAAGQMLIVMSRLEAAARHYPVLVSLPTGKITALSLDESVPGYILSPDGRWLVGHASASESSGALHLYDIEEQQTKTITFWLGDTARWNPTYEWSNDSQWLLVMNDGVLTLIAPESSYWQTIVPEAPGCIFAAWVNRK